MINKKTNYYKLPADGKWHTIVEHSKEGPTSFEINGYSQGKRGEGKYSVIYAIALNAYNGKKGSIKSFKTYYGWQWWRRLKLRWTGDNYNYKLQIKTCSDYGTKGQIVVFVKNLFYDKFKHV